MITMTKAGNIPESEKYFAVNVELRKSLHEAFVSLADDYSMNIQELLVEVCQKYGLYLDYTKSPEAMTDPDSEVVEYKSTENETVCTEIALPESLLESFYEAATDEGCLIEELITNFMEEYLESRSELLEIDMSE
ncbi:hypothetical protein FCL47_23565 [Desulfopila sp. IMCC35006]|uniref:hypothetical protein n=1 Tax=Desulfopila sp. IMCC35006 TaxID=2569542 RepID=UPI0010AC0338|nr:hypothetical protein [Desulfopila sp. IMCC35006]TKB23194.1 hypothetical protein FCL47_23565 [Desulfopila sp. IMCC35006]